MTDGDDLAFRARVWGGERGKPPFVDMIGHLIFDPDREKLCFYYGFYDVNAMNEMLGSVGPRALERAAEGARAVPAATRRIESAPGFDPALTERLQVSRLR